MRTNINGAKKTTTLEKIALKEIILFNTIFDLVFKESLNAYHEKPKSEKIIATLAIDIA